MLLIVDDSFELSSQKATIAEKAARTEVWSRVLRGIVPARRLQDAFDRAFRDHKSSFPINGYDIKAAWEAIDAEEKAEAERVKVQEAASNAVDHCSNKANHVEGEHGMVEYADPNDRSKAVLMPCFDCRRTAFEAAVSRNLEARKAEVETRRDNARSTPGHISAAIRRAISPESDDRHREPETASEILNIAYREVYRAYECAVGQERDARLTACQSLVHAMSYVSEHDRPNNILKFV